MKWLLLLMLASPALAQDLPDPSYFIGEYELTGHGPGPASEPLADWVTISGENYPLTLTSCLGAGTLEPSHSPIEGGDPLKGTLGDLRLWCRFQSDGDNYPRLTCYGEPDGDDGPGLITLWPAHWARPESLAECPK